MARSNQTQQRQRTRQNPLVLGTFSSLALRYLHGTLGPKNELVGSRDTWDTSNGGFGGGAYNHWFQVNITSDAWIILAKGGPRPNYIEVSAYDMNLVQIPARSVWEADSVVFGSNNLNGVYYPYLDQVMGAGSDLYNTYNPNSLDKGNELYYPLGPGSYLICISTTRNELLEYNVGVVIEFPSTELFIELEDGDGGLFIQESEIDPLNTVDIDSPVTVNYTIPTNFNAFTERECVINSGVTVTIPTLSTWMIGFEIPRNEADNSKFIIEVSPTFDYNSIHDHSLSEWEAAWEATHQDTDKFPSVFIPLTNRP